MVKGSLGLGPYRPTPGRLPVHPTTGETIPQILRRSPESHKGPTSRGLRGVHGENCRVRGRGLYRWRDPRDKSIPNSICGYPETKEANDTPDLFRGNQNR